MTPVELRRLLAKVARGLVEDGLLPDEALGGPPAGNLFQPADDRRTGMSADWVTPVASRWAASLDLEPRELAVRLAQGLSQRKRIAAVEVAPGGLLVITLSDAARSEIIQTILHDEAGYAVPAGHEPAGPTQGEGGIEGVDAREPNAPAIDAAQLAHARLCRLVRNAGAAGVRSHPKDRDDELVHPSERRLLVALADFPRRMSRHVVDREGQLRALRDLAAAADGWDRPVRPSTADDPVTRLHGSRLALARAARVVLRNGLAQVGAAAPERM